MASLINTGDVYYKNVTNPKNSIGSLVEVAGIKGKPTIKDLLRSGANINAVEWINGKSLTPLSHAIVKNKGKNIQVLLEHGADTNKPNADGKTPLMFAVEVNSQQHVKWLLERGAELERRDKSGKTALVYCIAKNHYKLAKYLLSKGACADTKYRHNIHMSALMHAAHTNNIKLVQLLVMYGTDPWSRDHGGHTAVNYTKFDEIRAYLMSLNKSKEWNSVTSPLYECISDYAAFAGTPFPAQTVSTRDVSEGTSSDRQCSEGVHNTTREDVHLEHDYAYDSASITQYSVPTNNSAHDSASITRYSIPTNDSASDVVARIIPLPQVVDVDARNILPAPGEKPSASTSNGRDWSPSSHQSPQNINSTVFANKDLQFDSHLEIEDTEGYWQPVNMTASSVDVNATNVHGQSALHLAAMRGNPQLIALLLEEGAKADVKDKEGNTPLMLATWAEAPDALMTLLDLNYQGVQPYNEEIARFESLERQPDHHRNSYYPPRGIGYGGVSMATGIQALRFKRSTALLTDVMLERIARVIGDEQRALGTQLGFHLHEIDQFKKDEKNTKDATFKMLVKWKCSSPFAEHQSLLQLKGALVEVGRHDVIRDILQEALDQAESYDAIRHSVYKGDNEGIIINELENGIVRIEL